jgi:hypothetical protein
VRSSKSIIGPVKILSKILNLKVKNPVYNKLSILSLFIREEAVMKRFLTLVICMLIIGLLLTSCDALLSSERSVSSGSDELSATQVALAIQQTSLAMDQTRAAQGEPPAGVEEQAPPEPIATLQPTYTLYPTYTVEPTQEPPPVEEPTPTIEEQPAVSFEDWLKEAKILLYDDMYGLGEARVIQNAVDGLGLGRNTTDVQDYMGRLLSNMNSATDWDLVIIAAERRDSVSGEYFDALSITLDRGSSIILEIWYLDQVHFGKIQPVMQRCGIAFHRDWPRNWNSNLNDYLVYLLEPTHPLFSEPNSISMLIPYDVMWWTEAGDLTKVNPGTSAGVLLAGAQQKEFNSYGLITDCMDGRMIWQTFSTHDYRTEEMINLWQNYITYALKARYAYLFE